EPHALFNVDEFVIPADGHRFHRDFVEHADTTAIGLERLLDPIYRPLRNFLPRMGGLDLSPVVALLGLEAIRIILINNISMFY
ncbi:MAG: YggT family protein, partial [Marivivens sp.]|nr:YggT family protein [Marivivens sp.]